MKQNDNLNHALTELAKLQTALDEKGGPAEDGQLFEQILEVQDEILKSFGLPATSDNGNLLWFGSLPTDSEVENRIKQLHETATNYLLSNAKPGLQILREAQEFNQDPFVVLPELKISTHTYTFFVYNEILLKKKDTVENILHDLELVNYPEVLEAIGNLEQAQAEKSVQIIQFLKETGVKYLDEFLLSMPTPNDTYRSSQLLRFLNEINGNIKFNSLDERFNSITSCLMNYLYLTVGRTSYRITECEIYYFDAENHSDPYVHRGIPQQSAGKLYLNKAGGLDITFGDANLHVFAGILIRGIRNLQTNEYTNKITEIVSKVFDSLGNIITGENGIYLRELAPEQIKIEEPTRTTRIGLTKSEEDFGNFIDKPYRYIIEVTRAHNFKNKEKVVKQLLSDNKISEEEAKNILGYNTKS
jgi:hypothetical protein